MTRNQTEMVESHDPNKNMKERACYDILMRTNKDKPSPPRDPNKLMDSVKSDEVLIQVNRLIGSMADGHVKSVSKTPSKSNGIEKKDVFKVRRESRNVWMNRLNHHIERSEAMKDHLDYDCERIRRSYGSKKSIDGKTKKKRLNKLEIVKTETDNTTDDERKSEYAKDYYKPADKEYNKETYDYLEYV